MKTSHIIQLLLSGISLYILVQVLSYLNEVESCPCFNEQNNKEKYSSNIEFMKFYQFLEIISLIIFIVLVNFYKFPLKSSKINNRGMLKIMLLISLFVLLFVSGYMSYNVAIFYLNMKKECICVNKWQKYFLYLEGIFNSIYFLRILYIVLFIMMLGLFNFIN